jgi:signal transduction histidine kinase
MRSRRRLRTRLIVSFALFGLGLSVLFAVAAMYVRAKVEDQLVISALQHDVDQAVDQALHGQPAHSELVEGWFKSERTLYKMPLAWQHLGSGVHDITETDAQGEIKHYKLAVRRKDGVIGFVRYDVGRDELGKQQLLIGLIAAVVLFSLLSLAIGAWLSSRVLRPVTELAGRLRDFRRLGKAEPLAPHFTDDEVGELAQALDEYSERLTALVARDREFNSDVSHELRTPLAVIASTTELLQSSPDLTDKLRERLKRIERASRQATEMIEALLLLSRAERRGPTFGEITDASRVAADVVESQRPQLGGKSIELKLAVAQSLKVNAPASVLAVVLTNLIGNAVKYTQQGEVAVRVLDDRIVIEDTGPGVKAEDAETLFQRGVRGEGVGGSGAGLGLAIVRRLCDLYGWDVSLRPREDVTGAVAVLQFPMRRE